MAQDRVRVESTRREYDWEKTTPTYAILEAIAVFEHGDPNLTEEVLETRLFNYVDADGLQKLVHSEIPVTIEFTIPNYDIQISGNQVTVTAADADEIHSR